MTDIETGATSGAGVSVTVAYQKAYAEIMGTNPKTDSKSSSYQQGYDTVMKQYQHIPQNQHHSSTPQPKVDARGTFIQKNKTKAKSSPDEARAKLMAKAVRISGTA